MWKRKKKILLLFILLVVLLLKIYNKCDKVWLSSFIILTLRISKVWPGPQELKGGPNIYFLSFKLNGSLYIWVYSHTCFPTCSLICQHNALVSHLKLVPGFCACLIYENLSQIEPDLLISSRNWSCLISVNWILILHQDYIINHKFTLIHNMK